MKSIHTCPVCGEASGPRYGALLAPFIAAWVKPEISQQLCSFKRCNGCGLGFFEQRFNQQEMDRLYASYRSPVYLKCRRAYEPWYTEALNESNLSPGVIATRRSQLEAYLSKQLPRLSDDLVIVDLGGDAGQFIPRCFDADCYVIESSDRVPWPAITRVNDLTGVRPANQLLLICSHVLEHLPEPLAFLRVQLQKAQQQAAEVMVYLEVPLESFHMLPGTQTSLYRAYLRTLQTPWLHWLWMPLDLLSLLSRRFLGLVFPPLVLKLHEHINVFSETSLARLAQQLDLEIVNLQTCHQASLSGDQGIIRLLAVMPRNDRAPSGCV
jgi:hypothetical protein